MDERTYFMGQSSFWVQNSVHFALVFKFFVAIYRSLHPQNHKKETAAKVT
jgi:hypothetical protein